MEAKDTDELFLKLKQFGFTENWKPDLDCDYRDAILYKQKQVIDGDTMLFNVVVADNGAGISATDFDAILRKPIDIPHVKLDGVDSEKLDRQMAGLDWESDQCDILWRKLVFPHNDKYAHYHPMQKAISDVMRLERAGPVGKDVSERLQMKYWPDNSFDMLINSVTHIQNRFETWKRFPLREDKPVTVAEAYSTLCKEWARKVARREKKALLEKPLRPGILIGKKMAGREALHQKR